MTDRYAAFAALHNRGSPLFLPNAWDFSSAAALAGAGFAAIGTTSLGVAAAAGKKDASGAIREENIRLAARLSHLSVLVSVDSEAGYSDDPGDVASYVAELARVGAVGINIEDGDTEGKLSEPSLLEEKVRAVKASVPGLFVNARTDAFWLGDGADHESLLAEAIARVEKYVAAGADGVFVPGLARREDISAVSAAVTAPLNVLFTPGISVSQLWASGAQRVSTGSFLFRWALGAATEVVRRIASGEVLEGKGVPSYRDVQALDSRETL